MVLISGGAHTGACYLATADGRPGWAHAFVRAGHTVVVPDWPGVGRSGHIPLDQITGEVIVEGLGQVIASLGRPAIVMTHSMSGAYGWKLVEKFGQHIDGWWRSRRAVRATSRRCPTSSARPPTRWW
jgi:pimeloyl-ACP methyl ester carboxylesterase